MSANTDAAQAAISALQTVITAGQSSNDSAQSSITAYEGEGGHLTTTAGRTANTNARTALLSAAYWAGRQAIEAAIWAAGAGSSQFITGAGAIGLSASFGVPTVSAGTPVGSPSTFFSDSWTGVNGVAWDAAKWNRIANSGGAATIQGNNGQLVTTPGGADDQFVAKHTAQADMIASGTWIMPSATVDEQVSIWVRGDGVLNPNDSGYANTGYGLVLAPSANQIRFRKSVAGVKSTAVSYNYNFDPAHLNVSFELSIVGSSIEARVWNDGQTRPSVPTFTQTDTAITAAGFIHLATTSGAAAVTALFDTITGTSPVISGGGGGGGTTPKAFANVWGAYTDLGPNGTTVQSTHTAFESFMGKQSNVVVLMADNRRAATDSGMHELFGATQNSGYQQWTPGNKGSRRFILFWPLAWAVDTGVGGSIGTEQTLVDALADATHISMINQICDNYLIPCFGDGTGLTIRNPHEWEENFYPGTLGRNVLNTPARMVQQATRQYAAFTAKLPNVTYNVCSIAGSVPISGSPAGLQVSTATRQTVLDGLIAYFGAAAPQKLSISMDLYDNGDMTLAYGDERNLFDYAVAHGLKVGTTETGLQSRGDNAAFPSDHWNNMKSYGQSIDHFCWFNSSQGGFDRRLEVNPNARATVLNLIATG